MSAHNDETGCWMVWDNAYELGIPTVDEQHRHLVYLCDKFRSELMHHSSREGGGWQTALSEALRETVQYTKTHFSTEEKLMQASGYPGYEYHKRCHQEFVDTITQILESFQVATMQTAFEFSSYLKEWVLTHIAFEDRQFQGHILEYCKQKSCSIAQ